MSVFGMCCGCENGFGTPTLRNIDCHQCTTVLACNVAETWRFSFVASDTGACAVRTGLDAQLQEFYLVMTGLATGCPIWLACAVSLCPYCGGVSQVPGTITSLCPDESNSFVMGIICAGVELNAAQCAGDPAAYTLTEDCMVIELRIEDSVESTWWICPLSEFNCNGANTFDLVLHSRVADCCTGATSNVSYPTTITIRPASTPACVSGCLAP